jgi:hypothetical protein
MSRRSSLVFVVIDQFLTELWALELGIFMKISVFWTFFFGLIFQILKFSDIEMKLGMIAYSTELQIKFEFCSYWSIS